MGFNLSPADMFAGWGRALTTPLGLILLGLAILYIVLRITGKIPENPLDMIRGGRKGGQGGGNNRPPDYILR